MFKRITPRLSIGAACMAAIVLCNPRVAHADVVLDWNVTMLTTLAGQNPFVSARIAAITQLAVFEAVNAINGEYRPYLGTISAPAGASADAAAAQAAHDVLMAYVSSKGSLIEAALDASLAAVPDGQAKTDGVATGKAAAAAMIALRADDGAAATQFYLPAAADPGQWQVTPSCPALGGVFLHWRSVTPFGVPDVHLFRPGPPPPLTSEAYRRDYDEVKAVGGVNSSVRPADRADIARFYASFSPVAWPNVALQQVAASLGQSVSENARALALLNMAISDASVASFATKYHYNFWRPETAIRAGDTDGNKKTDPDLVFAPYIVAPCFPSYPSNHASLSNAAREVLESLYGRDGHDITFTNVAVPGVTLHYANFEGITHDIDDARVYGGIHFRFDQETGGLLGRRVGAYVYTHNLRVVHHE
jgi:PAP2 superfamily